MSEYKSFEQKIRLLSSHVGPDRRVKRSVLFRMLQELTIAFTESEGVTRRETLDKGILWIIARQQLEICRLPVYDEEITLTCYALPTMHVFFPRYYEVYAGEEKLLSCSTLWLLMDTQKRTPVFPEEHGIFLEGGKTPEGYILPQTLRISKDAQEIAAQDLAAPLYMADINGHLNNSSYLDLVEEMLLRSAEGEKAFAAPQEIAAEYIAEVMPGEKVRIRYYIDGKYHRFAGTVMRNEGEEQAAFRIFYR